VSSPADTGEEPLPPDDLRGLTITLDADTQLLEDGSVVLGGSPSRIVRLSGPGRTMLRRLAGGEPVPPGAAATALARRLLDGGLAHPDWQEAPFTPDDVTVVIPVLGAVDPSLLASVLRDRPTRVLIVDDASRPPVTLPDAAPPQIEIVRRSRNGGPAAARNTGLDLVTTPLTAFVDADCTATPGWLDPLLRHFADPRVVAVAPRVVAPTDPSSSTLARYEATRAPLDLGPRAARVSARSRVAYVPSTALVVRTDVLRGLGGFDETMRVGEDVDLVWRLDEAGWSVRYEPGATVVHHHRTRPVAWARRRFDYGTSAGPLAVRHPGALVPLETSPWSVAIWALAATGHPVAATAVAATTIDLLARRLASLQQPVPLATRIALRSHLGALRSTSEALVRPWWPLALGVAIASKRARRLVIAAVLTPPLWEWVRDRPRLDPVRWLACRVADDVAYGTGVWVGSWRSRTLEPLRPELTSWPEPGRYRRWRAERQATATRSTTKTNVSPPLITPPAPRSP
jgi:mycofactocin system glycosyltransferase